MRDLKISRKVGLTIFSLELLPDLFLSLEDVDGHTDQIYIIDQIKINRSINTQITGWSYSGKEKPTSSNRRKNST